MSRELWPVCRTVYARFSPDRGGPPFRSSRGRLEYRQHDGLEHCWIGRSVVVTAGGRELDFTFWLFVRAGKWHLCVRRQGLCAPTSAHIVHDLPDIDPAAPHWCDCDTDYFAEGTAVRLFIAPLL